MLVRVDLSRFLVGVGGLSGGLETAILYSSEKEE